MTETTQETVTETVEKDNTVKTTPAKKAPAKKPAAKKEAPKKEPVKKAPSKLPVAKDKKNGVSRPRGGTTSSKIWEAADSISKKLQKPAPRKDVLTECAKDNLNPATVATQYGRWCRYHGLTNARVEKKETEEAVAAAKTTDNAKADEAAA